MKKIFSVLAVAAFLPVIASGCAAAAKKPEATAAGGNSGILKHEKYVIKKGDSLWAISGKTGVYGDPFMWPMLFKANRDQIEDPDLIDANSEISVKKEFDGSEAADARQKAMDTPPFKEHSMPRRELPLKY